MLVVKRPFKNYGVIYTAGTVITEPAVIKRLKSRIAEGKIINVDEHDIESTKQYFKAKYGVDIKPINTANNVTNSAANNATNKVKDESSAVHAKSVATVSKVR